MKPSENQKLRIAMVAPLPPPPGGIGRWTEGLLDHAQRSNSVTVFNVDSAQRYREVWNLSVVRRIFGGVAHAAGLFARYMKVLLGERVDVLHITTSGSLGMVRDLSFIIAARLVGVPAVLHMHNGRCPAVVEAKNWETKLTRLALALSAAAIVLDEASKLALQKLDPRCRITVIENPAWRLEEALAAVKAGFDPTRIVFVGWVIPTKGVRELVQACCQIDLEFDLELVGPVRQEFAEELKALAQQKQQGQWLKLSGELQGRAAFERIASSAFLILPSYTEGCPYVVLEAMMLKKAVIATPVGAIPRLLNFDSDEPCGINVPVRDVQDLSWAIQLLLRDPAHAAELGARARSRAGALFSPEVIFAQYLQVWEQSRK